MKKEEIKRDDITANIYDLIEISLDYNGISPIEIEKWEDQFDKNFIDRGYSKKRETILPEEMEEYCERLEASLSVVTKRKIIDSELALRYISEDQMEEIVICRLFSIIKLDYREKHKLKDKFILLRNISESLMQMPFYQMVQISIKKVDSIVCESLEDIYQCLDKNMFGDCAFHLKNLNVCPIALKSESKFLKDSYTFDVLKAVFEGAISEEGRDTYQAYAANLIMVASYKLIKGWDEPDGIITPLEEMNETMFEIFKLHITEEFANQLVEGNHGKTIGGVRLNG